MTEEFENDVTHLAETVAASPLLAWLWVAIAAAGAVAIGFVASWLFRTVAGSLHRRHLIFGELRTRFPKPIFWLVTVLLWRTAVPPFFPEGLAELQAGVRYGLTLSLIGVVGWIIAKILILLIDSAMVRQDASAVDNFTLRRRKTQIKMIRRLVIAVVAVLTVGAMLLTIDGAETFGASLFASAGVASIVAGLAAQSTLGNLVAGLQLTFSNALKVGDTLEVGDEFGTVEEITLTYVVVQIWDDRRLVLPSTHFTTTPYINWTRSQTALTGTVFLQADYSINVEAIRAELALILDDSPEWDRRSWGLIVSDAQRGVAELRATMTAANGDDLWALRCQVREKLVAFIATQRPQELTHTRIETLPHS
ncbi:mechanosensitive ion channel family protein [Microbacterium amylolyticum]|uniref:Small-conductance mechanosensitive channel n=1 Tax=Microbacterium amylolyticum TaxID=936337 RepID=A0ABS4ZJE5_9MICO|nr:mechanosensitive ion channel domain-containing protein [Microbacterium amylolyticum]MBP2437407.1 small-conductance mechanosensitive channel [Microbacterium amylolyticum]